MLVLFLFSTCTATLVNDQEDSMLFVNLEKVTIQSVTSLILSRPYIMSHEKRANVAYMAICG